MPDDPSFDARREQEYWRKHSACIFLQTVKTAQGLPFFIYILVKGTDLPTYEALVIKNEASLNDYEEIGTILHAGLGEPSDYDKQYMQETYGYVHGGPMVPLNAADGKLAILKDK